MSGRKAAPVTAAAAPHHVQRPENHAYDQLAKAVIAKAHGRSGILEADEQSGESVGGDSKRGGRAVSEHLEYDNGQTHQGREAKE